MSPNVKADMRNWDAQEAMAVPRWALERASEITHAVVPQSGSVDTSNYLYQLPAGLHMRLTTDIARALVAAKAEAIKEEQCDQS